MTPKIGSLFDGSGGFPLSAAMCGIEPVWASEVEPFPIAVTRSRFPGMKHLGSVIDVKGDEVEPVDVITFGSPCQDLSVAGKRAGLKHTENGDEETTRSGLFMEAIRIIKEMRKATNGLYPRFAVWENVPGAFSSNKGEDFRIVLEEFIKVIEPSAVMPTVPKNGWPYADSYCGDGWSLSYRVLDAQFWGVPQRRRRIYLVADFGGECAGKVSFEREGLRGYPAQSGAQREAAARDAESGSGTADCTGGCVTYALDQQGGKGGANFAEEVMPTLCSDSHGTPHAVAVPYTLKIRTGCAVDASGKAAGKGALIQENMSATLAVAQDQYLFQPILDDQGGSQISVRTDGKSPTLRAEMHGNVPCVMEAAGFKDRAGAQAGSVGYQEEVAPTLLAEMLPSVCYSIENHPADSRVNIDDSGKVQTLTSRMGTGGGNVPMVMEPVPFCKSARARSADDATTWKDGKVANTLNTFDLGEVRTNELVVEEQPVYCLQGNGIDRADTAGCNGKGWKEDVCYTLNTIDRPAVAYWDGGQVAGTLTANNANGAQRMPDKENFNCVIALDRAFYNQGQNAQYEPQFYEDGTVPTLVAKGPGAVAVRYIVRRLTPTECARLQGFPDKWAHPDIKESLSDEEYAFWLNVRNTHAEINGKATKEYTRDQMLTWYNKLHTDSAEYKLWGNGIALPCALYVMQGIADALKGDCNV